MSTDRSRQDVAVSIVGWLSLVVTFGTLVLAGIALPILLSASGGIEAQRRSDEITACRSEYRAPIDRADAAVELADADLERARTVRDDSFLVGLVAQVTGDDQSLNDLLPQVPAQRLAVAAAQHAKDEAAADKEAASKSYDRAVRLSRTNPDQLLKECRQLDR